MIDLAALRAALIARGTPLMLAAADAGLPQQLRDLLATVPGAALTVAPGSGGITLDRDVLTVAGGSRDPWPVQGFTDLTVTLAHATVTVVNHASTSVVTGGATGTMPVGGQPVTVALGSTLVQGTPGWNLTLAGATGGIRATDLLALGQGANALAPPVPGNLDAFDRAVTVDPSGFVITFFPATKDPPWFTVALRVADARWTLIDKVLAFDGIDITAFLAPGSYSLTLVGHLDVDGVAVDVAVGVANSPQWTAEVRPSTGAVFPGIMAIARWLGGSGSDLANRVQAGFQSVAFDTGGFDAAIASMRIGFDWATLSLDSFEIVSLVTLRALRLDVAVRLPDLTVSGGLHDGVPLTVASVLASFGLPTDGVPAHLTVVSADFTARPGLGSYAADLVLDDVWQIGPLDVEQVAVLVSYDPLDGFTGSVGGTIAFGTGIELQVDAAYQDPSTGWVFTGTTAGATGLQVGDFLTELAARFGITTVPAALRSLSLTSVDIVYETGTKTVTFTCGGGFTVTDTVVDLAVDVTVTAAASMPEAPHTVGGAAGYAAAYSGRLSIGELVLDVVFDLTGAGGEVFVATYSHTGDATAVSLYDLVAAVSPGATAAVPSDLSIGLTDVKFLYTKAPTEGSPEAATGVFTLGLDLSAHVGLAELPLIGDELPAGAALAVNDVQLLYSSAAVDAATVAVANRLLVQGVIALPANGLAADVALVADLQVGADRRSIALGVPAAPAKAVAAAGGSSSQSNGAWFDIQRTIGVLTINRVGVLYQHNAVLFALDADIRLGPLGLSLDGLGVGSTLSAFQPVFNLDGLGLTYAEAPLKITGALLRVPDSALPAGVSLQYDGSAVVEAESFGLAAVGSWARMQNGQPSLFVFAQYDEPLGGPPALFVTGLMAGFGYNRALGLPAQDEVGGFPLLLMNQPVPAGGSAPGAEVVLAVLEGQRPAIDGGAVRQWIAPNPGSDWLAVGIVFTSFQVVHSRALLVAEFGDELAFALLGTSTLQLPMPDESPQTYAYVELDLEAVLKPAEGFFGLTAVLAPTSYVLTQACHLTGGFAMYAWFGDNPHAGQFVVTLGGYHPAFVAPPYYPVVPRLGFSWAVSDTVSISGSAYLAITPSCAMAGGALDVEFHDGDLRAWFTAHADLLLSWRPFFFTADIGVSIGVSYRLNLLFCYKTISLSLGASVQLWGPPTGGLVHVDLWIISFTVAFGAGQPAAADRALSWTEFSGLLPAATAAVTVIPVSGLLNTIPSSASSSGKAWLVRARDFRFSTQSAMPASHLRYGDTPTGAPPDQQNFDGAPVNVRPMNLDGVAGVHRLTLRQGSPSGSPAPLTGWTLAPRTASLPESLWGAPPAPFTQIPAAPTAAVLPDQFVGYDIQAQPPAAGATRGVFPIAELAQTQLPPGGLPLVAAPVPDTGFTPVPSATTVGLIAGIATAAPARTAIRDALAAAGAYDGDAGTLDRLAANAQHLFSESPMGEGQTQ